MAWRLVGCSPVEYGILGPLEVRLDGHPVELGTPKQRALLLRLLLAGGRVVSAERLADDLWAGQPPPGAAGTLQSYVSNLRRALEPDRERSAPARVLVTQAPGYRLQVGPGEVDAAAFEVEVETARGLLSEGRAAAALATVEQALARWRGEALAEVAGEPWARAEAARLEELRQSAIEDRVDALLAQGAAATAVSTLEPLVAEAPLRERRWAQLMLALYRAGRQADALRAYRRAREHLVEEMGLEPGPELRRLEEQVLAQSGDLDWRAPAGDEDEPAAGGGESRVQLVGRERELATLERALGAALEGRRQIALIAGEGGIGKTRLAEELSSRARRRGVLVLEGRGYEGEGAPPYWPWVQVLRAALASAPAAALEPALAPAGPELAALLPEIKELLPGTEPPAVGDADAARFRLADALSATLVRLSAAMPVLVVLDDLHWSDRGSLYTLGFLARAVDAAHLLVVGTYRPAEPAPQLAEVLGDLARRHGLWRVDVGGLAVPEVARVLAARLGADPDEHTATTVAERSGGNPFFVQELARALAAAKPGEQQAALTSVPSGARDVLQLRLDSLPEPTRQVLEVAAVAGRQADLHVLDAVLPGAIDHLEPALMAGVLVPVAGSLSQLRFVHDLIRETILDRIPPLRRARLHGELGRGLAEVGNPQPDELAEHFWAAAPTGFADEAFEAALAAAGHGLLVAADERAETHLQRALELVGRARPSPQRDRRELQATAQLVVVRQRRLGVTEASNQGLFERVRELSHSVGPSPELLATGIFEWGFHILRGSFGTARAVAGNLLELGAQTGESSFSAVGSVALGETLLAMGDAEGALTALQHAVVLADADPAIADHLSMDLRSLSRSFLLIVYAERGDEARCRSVTDEAVAYAAARPYDEVHLRSCTVLAAVILRDPHWALAEARAGIRRAQTHSYAFYGAMLEASAAWGTGLTDDVELGIERFDQALAQLDAAGLRLMRPLHEGLRAELALLAGRLDEAGEHATRGLRVAEAGERHFVPALHTLHARILAAGGDRAGAAGALDRARRLAPPGTVYLDQARAAGIELGLDVADLVDG